MMSTTKMKLLSTRASSMLESKCLDREVVVEAAGGVPVVGVDKDMALGKAVAVVMLAVDNSDFGVLIRRKNH